MALPVSTRVIADTAQWDAIQQPWNALFATSPAAATALDFAWLRRWWQLYGPIYGTGGLRIIGVWRGAQLVGILPLYLARPSGSVPGFRQLRLISTGEAGHEETCPDYMNLLYAPGEEGACTAAVWHQLGLMAWDHLELVDLPEGSPLVRLQERPAGTQFAEMVQRGSCPVADLGSGFEAYLTQLSSKTRQHCRQYLRAAQRCGAMFELATEETVGQFFNDLVRLHQDRWTAEGKPGCFAARRFTDFHSGLIRSWLPGGRAVLARLCHGGQVCAVLYGFVTGSKFDFYQSGIIHGSAGPFASPGTLANLLLMQTLSQRGVTAYDFLRGASCYKERLATKRNDLVALRMWRSTFRSAVVRLGRRLRRVARTALRPLRRS
jgi:hypothetical protein